MVSLSNHDPPDLVEKLPELAKNGSKPEKGNPENKALRMLCTTHSSPAVLRGGG